MPKDTERMIERTILSSKLASQAIDQGPHCDPQFWSLVSRWQNASCGNSTTRQLLVRKELNCLLGDVAYTSKENKTTTSGLRDRDLYLSVQARLEQRLYNSN
jgi:hypothetical protein